MGPVHSVSQPAVHPFDHVAVGVESDAYASVAEELLDVLRVLACHKKYCSAGVPEIVERDGGKLRLPK